MSLTLRKTIIVIFVLLSCLSVYYATKLTFSFSLDQFFPEGDEDLAQYKAFEKNFEEDVNFLLIALPRAEGVFDSVFLRKVERFSQEVKELPDVKDSYSLTTIKRPLKTPFGFTSVPYIHIDQPPKYSADKKRILQDERLLYNLIDDKGQVLVVALKTQTGLMQFQQAEAFIKSVKSLLRKNAFDEFHFLGSPYFTKEMVEMQKREVMVTTLFSGILVSFIMFLIFRRFWATFVALLSIVLGMLLFMGFMGGFGRALNTMSALYPMLMIIVGTSDVIHLMSKYIDELQKGKTTTQAINITIREVGLATLLTSLTTAIGFITLMTSRVAPIRQFGINAAIGVMIAYFTVILFTTALLSFFNEEQLTRKGKTGISWTTFMRRVNVFTKRYSPAISIGALAFLFVSLYGISKISTNYFIKSNLPSQSTITKDFDFFEERLAGFRPVEYSVYAQGDYDADDLEVLQQIDKVEQYLKKQEHLKTVQSITMVYKSLNQMHHGNRSAYYHLPERKATFRKHKKLAAKYEAQSDKVLLSKDKKIARISTRAIDIGADSLKQRSERIMKWIQLHTDSSIVQIKETGTGLIMDKNAAYIRKSLLKGLALAISIICLLMALLFQNGRMVLISLIPNVFPLLMAGAILGYLNIKLDPGVSIIFAIVFGIAVDDTIHFLSKYKLNIAKGLGSEEAIANTFEETGKAIILTSIILFFGFLVMLSSIHPQSFTIGILISITLLTAVIGDLLLIPILLRSMMNVKQKAQTKKE